MGRGPVPVWRKVKSLSAEIILLGRATWNEVGLYLCCKGKVVHSQMSVSLTHWLPFLLVCLQWLLCCCGGSTIYLGVDE